MGRVSRYKRLKRFDDPEKTDNKNKKYNLPMSEKESDWMPKRARMIMEMQDKIQKEEEEANEKRKRENQRRKARRKKIKKPATPKSDGTPSTDTNNTGSDNDSDNDTTTTTATKTNTNTTTNTPKANNKKQSKKAAPTPEKSEQMGFREFSRQVSQETTRELIELAKQNSSKHKHNKQYLLEKKQKLKEKKEAKKLDKELDKQLHVREKVDFNDVVQAPPKISVLPKRKKSAKGAWAEPKPVNPEPAELSLDKPITISPVPNKNKASTPAQQTANARVMELLRQRVLNSYKKAKKRKYEEAAASLSESKKKMLEQSLG